MRKGGIGGDLTQTGLAFEMETDLATALAKLPQYLVRGNRVVRGDKVVALLCGKYKLYSDLLEPFGVDWKQVLSKRLIPDEALCVERTRTLYIIEKKYQESEGSVDEKLQTCHFKKRQYSKLVAPLGVDVDLIYLLNDWFKQDKYADTLKYIEETGCHYHFNEIPLDALGLSKS